MDAILTAAPPSINPRKLVLMADIFLTSYFTASNALLAVEKSVIQNSTALVLGCGFIGIYVLISALEYKPKHVLAIDRVQSRLDLA